MRRFTLLAHADWSGARHRPETKRWLAVARRTARGWELAAPRRVADPLAMLDGLRAEAGSGAALLGLDLPIGLPVGFVAAAGLPDPDFPAFLDRAGDGPFLEPAATLAEVGPARPFFPAGAVSGRGLKAAFLGRLGLDRDGMLRLCDRRGETLREACGLFWTLGGNQVGKAAISGWRELLLPARRSALPVALWPFEGRLSALAARGGVVIAETYPAEAYVRAGLALPSRKRRRDWRAAQAEAILAFAERSGVVLSGAAEAAVRDGFGEGGDGEDPFDATLGALGMVAVADGTRADMPALPEAVRRWEGWMLGRLDLPP